MYLWRFKASAVDPRLLVNRQHERARLLEAISDYLKNPDRGLFAVAFVLCLGREGGWEDDPHEVGAP